MWLWGRYHVPQNTFLVFLNNFNKCFPMSVVLDQLAKLIL